jgi:DNA-binding NtrC family response regulator
MMKVWSEPGVGSRFEVWLPCITEVAPSAVKEAPRLLPRGEGETVLIVDDESERLLRDEEILAALGYEAVGFLRAEDALAACRAAPERFDVMVVGHLASNAAALELAAALHGIAPARPILLATASAEEIGAEALVAAGICEIVHRPLSIAGIAAALARCVASGGGFARSATNVTQFARAEITS